MLEYLHLHRRKLASNNIEDVKYVIGHLIEMDEFMKEVIYGYSIKFSLLVSLAGRHYQQMIRPANLCHQWCHKFILTILKRNYNRIQNHPCLNYTKTGIISQLLSASNSFFFASAIFSWIFVLYSL